ncbi:MAG TPA: restriction endonuclease [Flavobacterium sp.]|nr:restriction endonuclease [Flavobacterium sp.]
MNKILEILSQAQNKGPLLEEVVEDILKDSGMMHVYRQKSGAQYGYDVIARKGGPDSETWKFECKNLSQAVTIDDIAPKLIWHMGNGYVDRFILVSVSSPTKYALELFERIKFPFPIEIWTGEYLAERIGKSSRAANRIGIKAIDSGIKNKPILFSPNLLIFDTICTEKVPYSFDYFHSADGVIKAYTEEWINLLAAFCNNSKQHTFICTEINVLTLSYKKVHGRVLRQAKMKGLVKPAKIKFAPSKDTLKSIPLLDADTILEIKADQDELLILELDSNRVLPGHYELIFEAKGRFDGKDLQMYSSVFSLHVAEPEADILRLYTIGKFYDTVAAEVLKIDQSIWSSVKKIGSDSLPFLGPTMADLLMQKSQDRTWKIRTITGERVDENDHYQLRVNPQVPSRIFCDLGIPVQEKIMDNEDIMSRVLGDDWKNILGLND